MNLCTFDIIMIIIMLRKKNTQKTNHHISTTIVFSSLSRHSFSPAWLTNRNLFTCWHLDLSQHVFFNKNYNGCVTGSH